MKTLKNLEPLAEAVHESWSRWMEYLFNQCTYFNGTATIPAELVARWERQLETPYSELSEAEKESDRIEARKYLEVFNASV